MATQPTAPSGDNVFLLGITMAGAVSAGAYTAGVLDVLFRAIDSHNARFRLGKEKNWQNDYAALPRHKIVIKAMSGASAGGVCIGLSVTDLISLHRAHQPPQGGDDPDYRQLAPPEPREALKPPRAGKTIYRYDCAMRGVHDVWVENVDLLHETGDGFLSSYDLEESRPVRSLLNTRHIDREGNAAMSDITWDVPVTPGQEPEKISFLASDLDMFFTTTNLMGVPYSVGFRGSGESRATHKMAHHSTVRHFRLSGLGAYEFDSYWLDQWRDDGIPLTVKPGEPLDMGKSEDFEKTDNAWAKFRHASIATGAFPAGFSPRMLYANAIDFGVIDFDDPNARARGGAWPVEYHPGAKGEFRPKPFGGEIPPEDSDRSIPYVAVDGGAANNEPFEYARFAIRDVDKRGAPPADALDASDWKYLKANPRGAKDADRAVIMIDPFPEGPEFTMPDVRDEKRIDDELALVLNLMRLPGALINQSRFKPSELRLARDDAIRSRFLVAPSRDDEAGTHYEGARAIASGALGGFIGFFDRNFRSHDFQLGQHNCASFLSRHFNLDPSNPVLGGHVPPAQAATGGEVPILQPGPELDLANGFPEPVWPHLPLDRLDDLYKQTGVRMARLGAAMIGQQDVSWFEKQLIGAIWWFVRDSVGAKLAATVLTDMIARDQIEGFAPPDKPDLERSIILSELARAGKDLRTPAMLQEKIAERCARSNDPVIRGLSIDDDAITDLLDRLARWSGNESPTAA